MKRGRRRPEKLDLRKENKDEEERERALRYRGIKTDFI